MSQRSALPTARTTGLVVKTVADKVLVYDLETHRAHSVNRVAAAVWRQCDGTRTAATIAAALQRDGVTEDAVRYALGKLGQARLLDGSMPTAGLTRREVMRRLGTAAAVALPMVTTIIAPTAAQAQSGPSGPGPEGTSGRPASEGDCGGVGPTYLPPDRLRLHRRHLSAEQRRAAPSVRGGVCGPANS